MKSKGKRTSINVRLLLEVHRELKVFAARHGFTLYEITDVAVSDFLSKMGADITVSDETKKALEHERTHIQKAQPIFGGVT